MILAALVATAPLVSASPLTPGRGAELNSGECDTAGPPAINVRQKVLNSVDSGEGGNYWAFDNYGRQIMAWQQGGDGTYCAVVRYQGKFDAQAGQASPGAAGTLAGDEDGTFQGGYRATIAGTLKENPDWETRGTIGTVDYQCDISGNCPGAENWADAYFEPGYSFEYEWWGWIYHGDKCGTWVNSMDRNAGDVLC